MNRNITIRRMLQDDYSKVNDFYIKALVKEHKHIAPQEDVEKLLDEYIKNEWLKYYFDNTDSNSYIATDDDNNILGLLTSKHLDSEDSIIFTSTVLDYELRDIIKDKFLAKLQEVYPKIKDMFIDVYEKNKEEVNFYTQRGFTVWETSTAPVGSKTVNVHLMQKAIHR
jgi:hypothetical protein